MLALAQPHQIVLVTLKRPQDGAYRPAGDMISFSPFGNSSAANISRLSRNFPLAEARHRNYLA